MKLDAGIKLPDWCNILHLSEQDHGTVMTLITRWNEEMDFIDEHKDDPFIIYGHVRNQEDIRKEILSIFSKNKKDGIN